jgi:predicted PurR-regulated permease PerM
MSTPISNVAATRRVFFAALLFIVTAAFIWLIRGFLQPIFWAIALAIVMFPIHGRLAAKLAPRESLAAIISMLLIVLIVILPLAGVAAAVTTEAANLYSRLSSGEIDLAWLYRQANEHIPTLTSALQSVGLDLQRLQGQLSSSAISISRFIASEALSIGQNTLRIAVFFFLMLYLLFFFLRDGLRMLDGLVHALPLGDTRERFLLGRFAEVSRATIKGTLVVGVVQGAIGGIAFALLGVGAPVLWGVVMALLSILPAVGPALVWIPAAIVLFSGGRWVAGAILIVVGVLVIGLVDNVLRPVLVGRDTRMPDYLILLSTLGGLAAFGLAGIVIGPIIAAFFLSTWEMAQEEYEAEEIAETEGSE